MTLGLWGGKGRNPKVGVGKKRENEFTKVRGKEKWGGGQKKIKAKILEERRKRKTAQARKGKATGSTGGRDCKRKLRWKAKKREKVGRVVVSRETCGGS